MTAEDEKVLQDLRYNENDMLPHEFLLQVTRGQAVGVRVPGKQKVEYQTPTLEQRIRAANMAAPYYAPKLSAVHILQGLGNEVLDQLIKEYAITTGLTITANREDPQRKDTSNGGEATASFSYLADGEEITGT